MRLAGVATLVLGALVGVAACGGPDDIRTVADFDANPCALFTDDALAAVVTEPYKGVAQADPKLLSSEASEEGTDTFACTYRFEAKESAIPQMATFTVTVAHTQSGNRPLAICEAGARLNNPGYKLQKFGDVACTSPSSDLWMRIGSHFFHVVVIPQPGFENPVDNSFAMSPVILAVAKAAADRMPKS